MGSLGYSSEDQNADRNVVSKGQVHEASTEKGVLLKTGFETMCVTFWLKNLSTFSPIC